MVIFAGKTEHYHHAPANHRGERREVASMKKLLSHKERCRYCHLATNALAPCCDACGFDFTGTPLTLRFQAPWKRRIIATGTGLVAVAMVWFPRP